MALTQDSDHSTDVRQVADGHLEGFGDPVALYGLLDTGRVVAIAGGLLLLVVHTVNALWFQRTGLDANAEGNIWTWTSVVATFGVALGAALHALGRPQRRRLYIVLATSAAFLSADDLVGVHEWIADAIIVRLGISQTWDSFIWPVLYLPLMAGVVVVLLHVTRGAAAPIRRQAIIGLGLLGVAVAAEFLSAPWSNSGSSWINAAEGGVEEAFEQAGWTLLASSTLVMGIWALLADEPLSRRGHSG